MANAVKMLPFPVTSDSAELTLLWGRGIHGRQFGYRISFMMGRKNPKIKILKGNYCTGGPLLTWFFETLEKQPCKQKTL